MGPFYSGGGWGLLSDQTTSRRRAPDHLSPSRFTPVTIVRTVMGSLSASPVMACGTRPSILSPISGRDRRRWDPFILPPPEGVLAPRQPTIFRCAPAGEFFSLQKSLNRSGRWRIQLGLQITHENPPKRDSTVTNHRRVVTVSREGKTAARCTLLRVTGLPQQIGADLHVGAAARQVSAAAAR